MTTVYASTVEKHPSAAWIVDAGLRLLVIPLICAIRPIKEGPTEDNANETGDTDGLLPNP